MQLHSARPNFSSWAKASGPASSFVAAALGALCPPANPRRPLPCAGASARLGRCRFFGFLGVKRSSEVTCISSGLMQVTYNTILPSSPFLRAHATKRPSTALDDQQSPDSKHSIYSNPRKQQVCSHVVFGIYCCWGMLGTRKLPGSSVTQR